MVASIGSTQRISPPLTSAELSLRGPMVTGSVQGRLHPACAYLLNTPRLSERWSQSMSEPPLLFEPDRANRRALMTFNRPERMNAMSPELQVLMREAIEEFKRDPDLWVLIVTGAGERSFSAGADLSSTIPNATAATREEPLKVNETRGLHDVHKPVIAAVNGYCIAGGLEFMLGTDIRVAAEHAEFGLQEVRWGIIPIGGSHIRLPRQIPWCWAMEILLTGRRLSAAEALQCGLVNRVVPADQLMETAHGIAD
ncbi:MAG: enoyl-CoA hydratase/isomerase family protein, partial [Chloroflexi bacterium]|nr:enoyl-CoA hydratase/isomerase family protein [Chloroflexota bacterium]